MYVFLCFFKTTNATDAEYKSHSKTQRQYNNCCWELQKQKAAWSVMFGVNRMERAQFQGGDTTGSGGYDWLPSGDTFKCPTLSTNKRKPQF